MNSKSFHTIICVILAVVTLVPIWATEHFPSQNGPWFMLSAHVFRELGNEQFDYDEYYVRNWHPIPHMSHDYAVAGLAYFMPLMVAEKLMLSVFALLMPLSIYLFLRVTAPGAEFLAYFSFLMVHTFSFYRGYHDFTLSIPLFFLSLWYWYPRRENLSAVDRLVLTVLSCGVYFSHLIPLVLLACVMGWIRLFETKNLLTATLHVLGIVAVPILFFADYILLSKGNSWMKKELLILDPKTALEYMFMKFFFTMSKAAYLIATAAAVGLAGLFGYGLFKSKIKNKLADPWIALFLFLFVVYFFLPYKIVNWHKANTRLIPFVFGFGIVATGRLLVEFSWFKEQCQKWVGWGLVVAMTGVTAFTTIEIVDSHRSLMEYLSGIEHFEKNSTLLPIHLNNPAWGQVRPLTRAHEYYHIAKGGANGYSIGRMNTLTMAWFKEYPVSKRFPTMPMHTFPDSKLLTSYLPKYDYVLVWEGSEKEIAAIESAPLKLVHHENRLRLYRVDHAALGDAP